MRNRYKSILSILISALFIYLAFRDTDLRDLTGRLANIPLGSLVLCFVGQLLSQILHWSRWGISLRRLGRVSWWRVFIIGAIGNAALMVLPARSGELVRPTLASREEEIDFGQASATSVLERIVDGLIVTAILFGSLQFIKVDSPPLALYNSGLIFLLLFLSIILILFASYKYQQSIIRMLQGLNRWISDQWVESLTSIFESFIFGTRIIAGSEVLIPYLIMSIVLWGMDFLSIYWLFGILSVELPFIASLFVIAILAIGKLIPSGPAQLGVFEFSIVLSLELLSVNSGEAVLFASIFHVIVIVSVLLFGILGLWLDRFPRRES